VKPRKACSLAEIARQAGVTPATVSYALRNKPGVSRATQERILKISAKLGYSPDSRMATIMAATRRATTKTLLPIVWLNNHTREDAWSRFEYLRPYLEGAKHRAIELGYRLEEIWTKEPGMTARRLSRILYSRGIEGVIVTQYVTHIRLNWDRFAAVALHGQLVAPSLPHVAEDLSYNLFTVVKQLRRLGFRKVGICLEASLNTYAYVTLTPVARYLTETLASEKGGRIPPLFYPWGWGTDDNRDQGAEAVAWIRKYRPEAIVCHSSMLLAWIRKAGLRVPEDIALAHLATDDDVSDWAGIHSNRRACGAIAVDQVVSRIVNRQFGIPRVSQDTLVRGEWHGGWTVSGSLGN